MLSINLPIFGTKWPISTDMKRKLEKNSLPESHWNSSCVQF
jgi:hypothetical protein